jgi:hypothetical protein
MLLAQVLTKIGIGLEFVKRYPRAITLIVVALCIAGALDFRSRIHVPREPALRVWRAPTDSSAFSFPDQASVSAKLGVWLPAAPTDEPKPRDILVQGVFTGNGVRAAALVLRPVGSGAEERRLISVGEQVEGWVVESINANSVLLSKGEERKALKLLPGI